MVDAGIISGAGLIQPHSMQILRLRSLGLLAVILGAAAIMILDTAGYLGPADSVIQRAITPLTVGLTELRTAASNTVTTARDLRTLRRRNSELETLVERLTVENLQLSELIVENETLRTFFEFAQSNPTYDYRGGQIVARVISQSSSPFAEVIQIDLGHMHGIKTGMPVVTDRGFVGRVVEVFPNSSQILLLNDANSSINVMTQASRAPGALGGRAGQLPIMDYIPPDVEISVGEIVITSGLGGNFPKGLVVGQIVDVLQNDNQMFQQAIIRTTVDFDRLELVLVITSFPPVSDEGLEADADATPDAEAGAAPQP